MTIRSFCVAVALGLFAAVGGAAAQPPPAQPAPTNAIPASTTPASISDNASGAYILGRDDVIEVGLLGRTDFSGRTRVQADGTIQLPLIGKLQVAERTTAEVSELVRKALQAGGFFADPVVTVEVSGYASRYVTVLGAVGNPGLIPINRPYRLSEILARVGGVRDGAADYLIVRSADGEEKRPLIRELATGGDDQDPYVKPGDKIYAAMAEKYYIYGQVRTPGEYPVSTDSTVRIAIAKAGGLTESGSDKKIDVSRGGKKVKLDINAKIEPGDVLEVGERLF